MEQDKMELTIVQIKSIMENNFQIPSESSLIEITLLLIEKLGSIDSDIREGCLEILYAWIMNGEYDDTTLNSLGDQLISLTHTGLGQEISDLVFLRSFTALEVAVILIFDEKCEKGEIEGRNAFLTPEIVKRWFTTALEYYQQERDYRSYVIGKGWAHSIAHGADLFRDFAKHRFIQKEEILQILQLVKQKLASPSPRIFNGKEELRIASAVYTALLRNKLDIHEINHWLSSLFDPFQEKRFWEFANEPEKMNSYIHVERFIKDFYLMIKFGISRKGIHATPYYYVSFQNRDDILKLLEQYILKADNNSFYYKPD
ncbi:MAG: DUF2785 domain-containing protein [Candidatus Lokiarchaeota archaeon]|nr:DUF2785 domain-containing protein [Candidatus Lokiarchaeota archaeon]